MTRSNQDDNLPESLRVTGEDVEAAASIWEMGYAALASRLNDLFDEIFPDSPQLRLEADEPSSHHGLQYYYGLFQRAFPAALLPLTAVDVKLMRDGTEIGQIDLGDHDRAFPWCIGFTALGKAAINLDQEFMALADEFRASNHDAAWFEENVVRPTLSQAEVWRGLLSNWRQQYPVLMGFTYELSVDVEHLTATLDGNPIPLPTRLSALFLQNLLEHPGAWVSSKEMAETCPELDGTRLDRLRLPDSIRSLIESKTGSGYRLKVAD